MKYRELTSYEKETIRGGAAPTLASVLAVGAIALITITVFKLYQSSSGKSSFGSGYSFEWKIED